MALNHGRAYIIAETGINHNGSIENCFKMIDAAGRAGCDAVKFQFFKAERLYPRSAGLLDWTDGNKKYSYDIYSAAKSFELPDKWINRIIAYCGSKGIDFLSSVFDAKSAGYLVKKGMKKIKIPSYAVTNLPLLEHCASFNLPIIMSTGGSKLGEIEDALGVINRHYNKVSLLHCSIKYPTNLRECNLGVIETLRLAFPENPVGYSDHTKQVSIAAVQAVYLGARIIEKHITLDKKMAGPDHFFAIDPVELRQMVRDIRRAEADYRRGRFKIDKILYGNTAKIVYPHEKYLRDFAFMRLYAKRGIEKGSKIVPADIMILRSGKKRHGLEPKYLKLFEEHNVVAGRKIHCEDPVTWDCILLK